MICLPMSRSLSTQWPGSRASGAVARLVILQVGRRPGAQFTRQPGPLSCATRNRGPHETDCCSFGSDFYTDRDHTGRCSNAVPVGCTSRGTEMHPRVRPEIFAQQETARAPEVSRRLYRRVQIARSAWTARDPPDQRGGERATIPRPRSRRRGEGPTGEAGPILAGWFGSGAPRWLAAKVKVVLRTSRSTSQPSGASVTR
jgi:hypothetical protein